MQPDTLRIDAHDKRAQHKALAEGYKFIETLHTYEMGLPIGKRFVRPVAPTDLPDMIEIGMKELRHSRLYADPEIPFEDAQAVYRDRINYAYNNFTNFVAVRNSGVIGFASLDKNEIELIAVSKEYQRMGIGTLLTERCAEECLINGYEVMRVKTQGKNKQARKFYNMTGFICTKVQHDYHKRT